MKLAVISDIHSNQTALESVLSDIDKMGCHDIICLGDIVGYGPNPKECINIIRQNEIKCLMGNHDAAVCGLLSDKYFNMYAKKAVDWTINALNQDEIEYLKTLAYFHEDKNIIYIHGALSEPFDYILDKNSLKNNIEILKNDFPEKNICFFGHTHIPFLSVNGDFKIPNYGRQFLNDIEKNIFFINPGSVGQPRGGITANASYCIFNKSTYEINYRNIEYDIDKTYKNIIDAGLPEYLGQRLYKGM